MWAVLRLRDRPTPSLVPTRSSDDDVEEDSAAPELIMASDRRDGAVPVVAVSITAAAVAGIWPDDALSRSTR